MFPTQGVVLHFAASPINTAAFRLADYLPAVVVAVVIVSLAVALVVSVRRKDAD